AIARDYGERYGVDVNPARIVVTAGASAALSLACCALVDPGSEVLMTDPGYPCNRHFVAAFDGVPRPNAGGPETRFQLTRDAAEAAAALSLACCALVDPGGEVLTTDPGYPCNRHFVAACHGVPRPIAVDPGTRFQLTRDALEAHWSDATRGVLVASPANPTGT